jgi:hypothetical protein
MLSLSRLRGGFPEGQLGQRFIAGDDWRSNLIARFERAWEFGFSQSFWLKPVEKHAKAR